MGMEADHMINMRGAFDLHFHTAPCIFPRIANDRQVAEAAAQSGFAGLLYKCHHESTVSRAHALDDTFPDLRTFGGIVLNSYVGGINPKAVKAALQLGAKAVWLPTCDSAHHVLLYGSAGKYDKQTSSFADTRDTGISVVANDELTDEAKAVFQLVAEHDVMLGTSHQSYKELQVIVPAAFEIGVTKLSLTHPFFKTPGLTLDQLKEFIDMGAIAELGYCTISPMWASASLTQIVEAVQALGAEKCTLVSDAGQRHNPIPPEALRVFAQSLFESGISEEQLDVMLKRNPAKLLGLYPP